MTERKKTTVYIDADLLRAAKVAAAREDKPDYVIFEEALKLRLGHDVIERVQKAAGLGEDEAMSLALQATKAARRARPSTPKKR